MGEKRRNKQQKTTRKKYHHTHDASLPFIEVSPNINNETTSYLPKIIIDCDAKVAQRHIKKIQRYLRFADPHDLRHLSSIRIVEPSAIRLPSKDTTDGCYCPKKTHRAPEIWLSSRLFQFPGFMWFFTNLFILKKNRVFETIFHELGHHKAHTIRLVSAYKQEAYADKYMQAYKRVWQEQRWWDALTKKFVDRLLAVFSNRYMMLVIYFFLRRKSAVTGKIYDLHKAFAFRRISREEFEQQFNMLIEEMSRPRKAHQVSGKWTHPLQKTEYRKKFRLDDDDDSA